MTRGTAICKFVGVALLFLVKQLVAQPVINSFSPSSGPVGTTVTISGSNFSSTPGNNTVYFGSVHANVSLATSTSITVTVPAGTSYCPITVTANNLTAYSSQSFITTFPVNNLSFNGNSFATGVNFTANLHAFDVSIHDLDGDGKPDVVVINREDGNFSVLRNTSSGGNVSLASKVDFTTGSNPYSLAVGDLNGDGKSDIAIPNNGSGTVSVFLNTSTNGNISFAPKVDFTTGGGSQGIAIGDLDGDGKPEMIATNSVGSTVSIFPNTSSGGVLSFASRIDLALPGSSLNAYNVTIGDMNQDNKPEIITSNVFTNNISVFRNTSLPGTISMASRLDFATGFSPQNVCVGDLDGDGKPDIAVGGNQTINALRNTGTGGAISFAAIQTLMATGGHHITLADFNGDGKPDIGSARVTSNNFSILRNSSVVGSIIFNYDNDYPPGISPSSLFAGDLDLDGKPDIVFPNYSQSKVTVLRNRINEPNISSFAPIGGCPTMGSTIRINGSNFLGATAVSFGGVPASSFAVNSDTSISTIVGSAISGAVVVTTDKGTGTLAYPPPVISNFTPTTASPGSTVLIKGNYFCGTTAVSLGGISASSFTINSDTSITAVVSAMASGDVVVTTAFGSATLNGFYNGPTITSFSPALGPVGAALIINGTNFDTTANSNIVFFGAQQASVAAGNNGSLTVTVPVGATYEPITVTASHLTAFSKNPFTTTYSGGDTISTASLSAKVDFTAATNPIGVSISDLDGDGKNDLIVANKQSNSVSYFKNTTITGSITSTSFAPRVDISSATSPSAVATGDINGDGKPDLLVANNGSASVSIFRNTSITGSISFAPKLNFYAGAQPTAIAIGDLDNDGKPDLVFSSDSSGAVQILRNTGVGETINFVASSNYYPVGDISYGIAIADLDGDGKPEIIVTRNNLSSISVFRNTSSRGNISFASNVDFTAGSEPYGICIADIDGDGRLDIAVANKASNTISILRNTSPVGSISFESKIDFVTGSNPIAIASNDVDGDGKPDLVVTDLQSSSISVFRNKSSSGLISLGNKIDFSVGTQPASIRIGDIDGDGKVDMAVANQQENTISILRNRSGEAQPLQICPGGIAAIASNIQGTNYQWQVNTGTGFANLSDNTNYAGTQSNNLQLTNIPSDWYGYLYRCVVDGNNSFLFSLKFENIWTGAVSSAWEDPLNWSCGLIPDTNTDVIINNGTVILSTNTTIRSLILSPEVNLVINTGVTLTITH